MEKDRNIKKLSVIALVVSILGLSIVFALLSVSLNVTGVAKINKSGLDVIFEKIPGVSVSKSKMVVLTYDEPEITDKGKTNLNIFFILFTYQSNSSAVICNSNKGTRTNSGNSSLDNIINCVIHFVSGISLTVNKDNVL